MSGWDGGKFGIMGVSRLAIFQCYIKTCGEGACVTRVRVEVRLHV
jgi:hypothetical protein